jgi:hypothetical protein
MDNLTQLLNDNQTSSNIFDIEMSLDYEQDDFEISNQSNFLLPSLSSH